MGRPFYNAKPSGDGCGCGFSFNTEDEAIYVSFVKQSSWDAKRRAGTFGGDKLNLKFSLGEAGGIVYAIENHETFSAYHDTGKGDYADKYTTQIKFMPFGEADKLRFGLSVTKKEGGVESKFSIAFSKGDAIVIREYLQGAIKQINDAADRREIKKRIEAKKQRDKQTDTPAAAEEEPAF